MSESMASGVEPGMRVGTPEFDEAVAVARKWRASGRIRVAAPLPDKPVASGKSGATRKFSQDHQGQHLDEYVIAAALRLPEPVTPLAVRSIPGVSETNVGNVVKRWVEMGWLVKDHGEFGHYVRTSGFGVMQAVQDPHVQG